MFKIQFTIAIVLGAALWTLTVNLYQSEFNKNNAIEANHVIQQ